MCPMCGSDDYFVLENKPGSDEPDYDGPKECEVCGEVFV